MSAITKPTPKGWPRISSSAYYQDANKAIDWLCEAFGFEVRLKVQGEGGRVEHSELVLGDGLVMIGEETRQKDKGRPLVSPRSAGGANTQAMMIFVDDCDAACARARAAGGKITYEPQVSDYGEDYWADKTCEVQDLEGHVWWLVERVRG